MLTIKIGSRKSICAMWQPGLVGCRGALIQAPAEQRDCRPAEQLGIIYRKIDVATRREAIEKGGWHYGTPNGSFPFISISARGKAILPGKVLRVLGTDSSGQMSLPVTVICTGNSKTTLLLMILNLAVSGLVLDFIFRMFFSFAITIRYIYHLSSLNDQGEGQRVL